MHQHIRNAALQADQAEWASNQLVQDQLSIADVIVVSKVDVASPAQLQHAMVHIDALYPPKQSVHMVERGCLPMEALHFRSAAQAQALAQQPSGAAAQQQQQAHQQQSAVAKQVVASHASADLQAHSHTVGAQTESNARTSSGHVAPGQPLRLSQAARACGWLFDPGDVFDEQRLKTLLHALVQHAARVKGVFRLPSRHACVEVQGVSAVLCSVAYRRDSRVEVIAHAVPPASARQQGNKVNHRGDEQLDVQQSRDDVAAALQHCDWLALERLLIACLQ